MRPALIGYLAAGAAPTSAAPSSLLEAFKRGLVERGWKEGESYTLESRWGGGRADILPTLAAELVERGVDVIAVSSSSGALAARDATRARPIPVVFGFAADPVAIGIVDDLARPNGNVTGFGFLTADATVKQLDLLKEVLPGASVVGVLFYDTPGNANALRSVKDAAQRLKLRLVTLEVRAPTDIVVAVDAATGERIDALLDLTLPLPTASAIIARSVATRIPSAHLLRSHAESGAFLSYGPDPDESLREVGGYVDKILRGAKVSELPVQLTSKFDLAINLKTAQAIGVHVPDSLLARAQAVIR